MVFRSRHFMIHGRVQGVGFRAWVVETARPMGLAGWVRNRREGTVEAVLSGSEAGVAAMIAACRSGPPHASVTQIVERDAEASELAMIGDTETVVSLPTV